MEPFAPFVRKSMCWIFTALPHIPLKMQLTLVNSSGFRVFPFWKGKGLLVVANAVVLLQSLRLSAACFCNGKACVGENDCEHICIYFLRCRRRPDLCMWWNTHVHVYSFVSGFQGRP